MIEALLRTILGTGLLYLLLCFIVSGLNEWIAVVRGSRGKFLRIGIRRLLPDAPIFRRVMQHPLISGMSRDSAKLGRTPSHLAPANFAGSLVEVIRSRAWATGWRPRGDPMRDLSEAAEAMRLDHPLVVQTIVSIFDRAGGDFDRAIAGIEAWFSSSMDRVRGWYLGFTRVRIFWLAFLLAAVANIDAIQVVRSFWDDARPELRIAAAPAAAPPAAKRPNWPIGYSCLSGMESDAGTRVQTCITRLSTIRWLDGGLISILAAMIGWLITATAVAIGAPYLYRLLTIFGR